MCVQNGHYCVIFMLLLKLIHFKKGVHDGEKCPSYIHTVCTGMNGEKAIIMIALQFYLMNRL